MKQILPLALCLCLCAACASQPKKQKEPDKPKKISHRMVGTIVSVNEASRFVLIDTGIYPITSGGGEALKSFSGDKETGVLTMSPERKPPFIIADIVSGSPQKGDQVFE